MSAAKDVAGTEPYFVMIFLPSGPVPLVHEDPDVDTSNPPVAFYATAMDANATAKQSRACMAYGYEIFRLGSDDYAF